jgi:DNA primase
MKIRSSRNEGVYERLRASIGITQVLDGEVGEKVQCIFHDDSDPSMHIYEDAAHCFACGAHADVTKIWKARHGFASMWEAAQDLARKFGVELPETSPEARKRYEERRLKEEDHGRVAAERHAALKDPNNPVGRKVQEYISGRGITDEIRDRFMLGATPDGDLNIPGWVGTQVHGQIIRRLEGRTPKYKAPNAEEFALGRRPIFMVGTPKAQAYLLVEGYLDQPAAEVLGIPAIGTGAARLSKEQIADLRELGAKGATFYVLPDGDETGSDAARTNTTKLYPYARMTPPIPGEGIKDVSDLHKADPDNAARILRDLMDEGRDAVEIALEALPKSPVEKVRYLKREIAPLILLLENRSERDAVIKEIAKADGLNSKIVTEAVVEKEAATLVRDATEPETDDIPRSEWEDLLEPGVLDRYRDAVCRRQGVVGDIDRQVVKTVTLAMVGAQLGTLPNGKPTGASMALLGASGRGKNFLCDAAVAFAPPEWYKAFTVASSQAFYWAAKIDPAFLKHCFIYPNEIEAIDTVVEFLRPMLSQGYAQKYVTNKDDNGSFQFESIEVEGPMTGVLPTVRNKLEDQLQTRLLITELEDYKGRVREQTEAASRLRSRTAGGVVSDEERKLWHAALRSLTGHRRVIWDFADHEGFGVDNDDLDHGARLWSNLLGLGEANAFLEQENRTIETLEDGSEVIVATAEDYKVAYELVEATATRSMVNVSDSHRKILNAMHELQDGGGYGGHSQKEIAEKAGVHPSTVTRNKTYLTKSVKFITEDFDGELKLVSGAEPSWWEEGEPMRGFPKPETVEGWSSESVAIPCNRAIEGEKPDTYAAEPVAEACNLRAIVAQEDDADPLAEGRGAPDVLTAPVSWEADGFEIEYMPDDADRMVFDALVEVCNEHPEKRGRAQRTLWLARAEAKGVSGNEFLDAHQDLDRAKRIKLEVLNDLDVGKWYPSEAGHSRRSLLTIRSGGTR